MEWAQNFALARYGTVTIFLLVILLISFVVHFRRERDYQFACDNDSRLDYQMNQSQVRALLGTPTLVETAKDEYSNPVITYYYERDCGRVSLIFKDDLLIFISRFSQSSTHQ